MQRNYIQNRTFCKFLNYLTQQCSSSPTPMAKSFFGSDWKDRWLTPSNRSRLWLHFYWSWSLSVYAVRSFVHHRFKAHLSSIRCLDCSVNRCQTRWWTISSLNDSITGYNHDDASRQGILSANGLSDGDPRNAINLNNLDDWMEFHTAEIDWKNRKSKFFLKSG